MQITVSIYGVIERNRPMIFVLHVPRQKIP